MRGELMGGGGRADPSTAISGPSSARHQNTFEMAFRWQADFGPTSNAGLVGTSITKNPYIFLIFQGGGGVRIP